VWYYLSCIFSDFLWLILYIYFYHSHHVHCSVYKIAYLRASIQLQYLRSALILRECLFTCSWMFFHIRTNIKSSPAVCLRCAYILHYCQLNLYFVFISASMASTIYEGVCIKLFRLWQKKIISCFLCNDVSFLSYYQKLVGFGLACAPVRSAHPSFWVHHHAQRGAARPPTHRSFAAPHKTKINYFQKQNIFLQAQTRAARGIYFSTGLRCTLLSCAAPYWATLHPRELRCTLLSYAAPY
jgi:hypothetical protein